MDHRLKPDTGVQQFALVARNPRTSQRAVGNSEFLKPHHPSGRRQGIIPLPEQIRGLRK
jgi:hypothetical protein